MAFDQYAWLDKRQSFGSSFTRYDGASTYQFSEYVRNPATKEPNIAYNPPPRSIPPPRSRIKQACEMSFQPTPRYTPPQMRSRPNVRYTLLEINFIW